MFSFGNQRTIPGILFGVMMEFLPCLRLFFLAEEEKRNRIEIDP